MGDFEIVTFWSTFGRFGNKILVNFLVFWTILCIDQPMR
jgi:hypothetical protein